MTFIFYMSGLAFFLPGLIVGLISSWHSNMFKTFLRHPSIFVLPVFTPFTFTSSKKTCCVKDNEDEGHLRFSVKASLCNLFASFSAFVVYVLYVFHHKNMTTGLGAGIGILFYLGVGDVCFFLTMRCFNDAMFSNS